MKNIAGFIVKKRKAVLVFYVILMIISGFGMLNVNVNYDMSQYLPEDSFTKQGMEKMSGEYGDLSSITVMFDDLKPKERTAIKEELASIPNVKSVVYFEDDEEYQKENHSKYMLAVSAGTYSAEAKEVLDTVKERFHDYPIAVSGAVVDNDLLVSTLTKEIPIIILIVAPVIFAILFLLCDSWIEPFLFMGCIGVAILINMGTNALLPSVSFMTFAVGALLQLGLSMDYSIMLMNRYGQEKLEEPRPEQAMKKALSGAFGAITGSSVTTIVGLLVLVFMNFKIGMDMGIVLAKGVFISLICIFTLLPGLIVMFDKLVTKTHKKSLNFKMNSVMKWVVKARFVMVPVIVLVVAFAIVVKGGLGINYVKIFDNEDQNRIEDVFGVDNQIVMIYDNAEDEKNLEQYINWLEGQEKVNWVQDYSNTIGKNYTYQQLAEEMDLEKEQAKLMYQMYKDQENTSDFEKITMYDLVCYIDENVASNPAYADFMSRKERKQITDAREELEDGRIKIADAEKEIADGEKELADGEKKLADCESELSENEKKLEDSEKELEDGEKELKKNEKKIANGEKKLTQAKKTLAKNEKKIAKGEKQLAAAEKQMAESEKQIADGEAELAAAKEQMKNMGLSEEQIQAQLGEQEAELKAGRMKLEAGKKELQKNKKEIISGRKQIESGKKKLKKEEKKLTSGRNQLEEGKKKLKTGRKQLENGRIQIADAKKELEEGWSELEDGKQELEDGKEELEKNKEIFEKPMDVAELADVMERSVSDVENMLKIKRLSQIDVQEETVTLEEFLNFITAEILPDETYAKAISGDMRAEIDDGRNQINENKGMMSGEKYNRMMVSLAVPMEGEETFSLVGKMKEKAGNTFSGDTWLVGDSGMGYEMNVGFSDELNFVTILTIVSILIVVLFTFRSLVSSVTLVAVIQSAVFIITAIVSQMGVTVNYIALILVQCILMGSTIDYGILFVSNYREVRREKDRKEAIGIAMNLSIRTIMTSSLILFTCCMTVGLIMTQKIISQTCSVIAYGVLCSVILVVFVLPALVYMLDRFIVKKDRRVK